jgi:hypothetical protein
VSVVIGLGRAGCEIANKFSNYSQYDVVSIDTENNNYENFRQLPVLDSHQHYDDSFSNLALLSFDDDVIFITCGAGRVSGASLRILEGLKELAITLVYIKPDLKTIDTTAQKIENLTNQILQQYTRSGVFNRMIMIDNSMIEEIVGDVPIPQYWDRVNETIASTIHMINVFDNSRAEISTFSQLPITARIQTVGLVNLENGEEKLFFDLQGAREKLYYYALNKNSLENEPGMYSKITKQVKSKHQDGVRSSFAVYSTEYNTNYVYALHAATLIQDEHLD